MKKILALLLALVMLLTLAACGEDKTETPESTTSTPSSSVPATSVPASTGSSEGTSQAPDPTPPTSETPDTQAPTTQPPATPPATTPPSTEVPHTHSYSSKVTTAATCDKEGVKTFTCSCGKSYTESIKATGHSMSGWKVHSTGSIYTVGEKRSSCANCSYYESETQYDAFFEKYIDTAFRLGEFASVNELIADSVVQAIIESVAYTDLGRNDRGNFCIGFKIEDVNTHTLNRFGRTYDYATMGYAQTVCGTCRYDADTNMLIEERYEADGRWAEYVGYTTTDNVHFVVTYKVSDGDTSDTHTCNIELISGKYIITSQTISRG